MNTKLWVIVASFLFAGSNGVISQEPQIQWDKTIGGNYADNLVSILPADDSSGFYLFGNSSSNVSGEKTSPPYTMFGTDIWIVKYDNNWQKEWDKVIGGTQEDKLHSVLRTPDGGFLLGATSQSDKSGDKSEDTRGTNGDPDYWIIKIDNQANVIWDKTIGGADIDDLAAMYYHPDGGYLILGTSYSGASYEKTKDSYGYQDYWAVHIDPDGNILWDNVYGGNRYDIAAGIYPLKDGFILTGKSDSPISGNKTQDRRGSDDGWIVKIDFDGNKIMDRAYGGDDNEGSPSIAVAQNGGYILSMTSKSDVSGDKTSAHYGAKDAWFVRVDKNWNIVWDQTIGTVNQDDLSARMAAGGGYFLIGTQTREEAQPGGGLILYGQRWLVQCDSLMNKTSEYQIGGDKNETGGPNWIMENDSSMVLIGSSSNSDSSGQKTQNSRGGMDFWLVQVKLPYGISYGLEKYPYGIYTGAKILKQGRGIRIYPNPAAGNIISLTSDRSRIVEVSLYSVSGVKVKQISNLLENTVNILVQDLPPGMYITKINMLNGKIITGKFIKK